MRDTKSIYREAARRLVSVTPAQPASLYVRFATVDSRDQAYALAFAIMAKADETWAR